ncbi:hypothetical protein FOXG_00171 [Fusarium oxysporum f. sp. lycopersici 4287]|uniref:Uncharacterized protein n=3 Tax=Fusarium oxysporum TaxID=5507 RepID=A0A0J9U3Z1_FUSO4|nr:hypothetical protein FOXG_00171 [Fusarium oxysporum f. sp. lycopersici 4287]EXK47423.1 hypothetical protein FOMG_00828 [Fusarium oxysporum f. sp. melonis 26406]KAJ9429138.1 hypothetical protein QL093DRAFT_2153898 [Fusarium oxysporum]KNA93818.1 hypothetical protein FOXG_00171 [Fusarium oxysporum f. sp. lycopersici 4287]
MAINLIRVLTWFLVGAVFASPLVKRNKTEGLSEKPKGTDFSRLEPIDRYRDDPRFPLKPSLFAAPLTRNSSLVARPIIRKRPDTEENEPKYSQIRQSGNKTEHDYKPPKPDGHMDVSLDKMEDSEDEKALIEALLKILNEPLEEIEKENPTGHTQIIENPRMVPYMWRDSVKLHTEEDKDEDKEHKEDDSDYDSYSDDEEDVKKKDKKVFRMIQKRDDEKEEKPYLWPEHNRPKASKDGKFKYLYSSEGKQYAVATPQHLANETNRHEKAQQEREQKVDILQHELQKEMDAKLQQVHSILKHESEMKFNAS